MPLSTHDREQRQRNRPTRRDASSRHGDRLRRLPRRRRRPGVRRQLSAEPAGVVAIQGTEVRATAAGATQVVATLNGERAAARVTVPSATLTRLDLSPAQLTLPAGATHALTVSGTLSDETLLELTALAAFTSSDPRVNVDAHGFVRALSAGTATVTTTIGTSSATTAVTVPAASAQLIAIVPASAQVPASAALQLHAVATYDDASQADVSTAAAWNSNTAAAKVSPACSPPSPRALPRSPRPSTAASAPRRSPSPLVRFCQPSPRTDASNCTIEGVEDRR